MGAELRGELLDCHLVVAGPGNIPGPDRTPRAEPATLQQAPDHRRVEGLLLGWFPALDVQAIRNVLCGGIPPTHLGDARDQTVELLQLFEAPDRAVRVSGHDAESMQNCGVITPLLLLPCGHHWRAGSPDSVAGRRPRACRSARLSGRPGRVAPSLCSSAFAAPCSCAWPRSRPRSPRTRSRSALRADAGPRRAPAHSGCARGSPAGRCERSPSPITRLNRPTVASARARAL